jgi:ribonuclease-3
MSKGERESGGAENPAILADCCEAVIGALYLDGGMEAAERFIYAHWLPFLNEVVRPPKDPKTALQEWAQAKGLPLPVYATVYVAGPDHDPTFSVQVSVRGYPRVTASGRSKRQAEQSAASLLLRMIRARKPAGQQKEDG